MVELQRRRFQRPRLPTALNCDNASKRAGRKESRSSLIRIRRKADARADAAMATSPYQVAPPSRDFISVTE
jgi:hypothetical protein